MIVEMDRDVQHNAYIGMGANLIAACTHIGLAMWSQGGLFYVALGLSFLFGFNFALLISYFLSNRMRAIQDERESMCYMLLMIKSIIVAVLCGLSVCIALWCAALFASIALIVSLAVSAYNVLFLVIYMDRSFNPGSINPCSEPE